jgi:hypothetical protein
MDKLVAVVDGLSLVPAAVLVLAVVDQLELVMKQWAMWAVWGRVPTATLALRAVITPDALQVGEVDTTVAVRVALTVTMDQVDQVVAVQVTLTPA